MFKNTTFFTFLCCAILFVRTTATHVYSHDDGNDVESCLVCDVLLDAQSSEVQAPQAYIMAPSPMVLEHYVAPISRACHIHRTILPSSILSRPPPALS